MILILQSKFPENDNVVSFRFVPRDNEQFLWQAGQYMRFYLHADGNTIDHWFTIASAPYEKEMMITTRIRNTPFKLALNNLKIGESIEAFSLSGDFVWQDSDHETIYIATGIGITSFHSILKERSHYGLPIPVKLLYATTDKAIIYRAELDKLARDHPELEIYYITNERISLEVIKQKAPHFKNSLIYVSGPEGMVDAISQQLQLAGVQDHNLKRDRFSGYSTS